VEGQLMRFKKALCASLFIYSFFSWAQACELTDEYKAARSELVKSARSELVKSARSELVKSAKKSFHECKNSISQVEQWHAFTQCIKNRDDKALDSTCEHITGHDQKKYEPLGIDGSFCDVLGASTKELLEIIEEHIKEKSIEKCKKT
jgi:hypothetical protein